MLYCPAPNPIFSKNKHSGTNWQEATAVASPQRQTNRAKSNSRASQGSALHQQGAQPHSTWARRAKQVPWKQRLRPAVNHPAALKPRGRSKVKPGSPLSKPEGPTLSLYGASGPWAEGAERAQVRLVRAMMGSQCPQLLLNPGKKHFQAVWRNDGHCSRKFSFLGTGSKFRPILWAVLK